MLSPARQHYIRKTTAAAAQAEADAAPRPDATQYELHLAQLAEHKRRLKKLQSVQRKIAFKAQILPDYTAYVDGVLAGDSGAPDDVITTLMVWRIDAGDLPGALDIAAYVLKHNLPLPDPYKRTAATVIAEEIAEYALRVIAEHAQNIKSGPDGAPVQSLSTQLEFTLYHTNDFDMPDEVRAKLRKAYGYAMRDRLPALALEQLRKAVALDSRAGVKKDIERLERYIKDHPEEVEKAKHYMARTADTVTNDPEPSSPPPSETSDGAAGTPTQSAKEAD